jgi:hypothetical protein
MLGPLFREGPGGTLRAREYWSLVEQELGDEPRVGTTLILQPGASVLDWLDMLAGERKVLDRSETQSPVCCMCVPEHRRDLISWLATDRERDSSRTRLESGRRIGNARRGMEHWLGAPRHMSFHGVRKVVFLRAIIRSDSNHLAISTRSQEDDFVKLRNISSLLKSKDNSCRFTTLRQRGKSHLGPGNRYDGVLGFGSCWLPN